MHSLVVRLPPCVRCCLLLTFTACFRHAPRAPTRALGAVCFSACARSTTASAYQRQAFCVNIASFSLRSSAEARCAFRAARAHPAMRRGLKPRRWYCRCRGRSGPRARAAAAVLPILGPHFKYGSVRHRRERAANNGGRRSFGTEAAVTAVGRGLPASPRSGCVAELRLHAIANWRWRTGRRRGRRRRRRRTGTPGSKTRRRPAGADVFVRGTGPGHTAQPRGR